MRACLIPVLGGFIALLGEDAGSVPATVPVGGNDGLWLGHAWIDGRRTTADLDTLAGRLRQAGIRDVFVHVGPLSDDGSLNPALLMTYDTSVPTRPAYSGYVRMQTQLALAAIPPAVALLIGLPAYHDSEPGHTSGETVAAAIRGVRLALGAHPPRRPIGVALYADYTATPADWTSYLTGWARPGRGAACGGERKSAAWSIATRGTCAPEIQ